MSNLQSPGVSYVENSVTNALKPKTSSIGGYVGKFAWGPAFSIRQISSELELQTIFHNPNSFNADDWFSARNFLDYSSNLKVVRAVDSTARNAYSFTGGTVLNCLVNNASDWESKKLTPDIVSAQVLAKYPGTLGNSIEFSMADAATFEQWKYRQLFSTSTVRYSTTVSTVATFTGTVVVGTNTINNISLVGAGKLVVGQVLTGAGTLFPAGTTITAIVNSASIQVSAAATSTGTTLSTATLTTTVSTVPGAPSTTRWCALAGGANDEVHAVVVDIDGKISGTAGTVLEIYKGLSKAIDSLDNNNMSNYYMSVINDKSNWVWLSAIAPTQAGADAMASHTMTGCSGSATSQIVNYTGSSIPLSISDAVYYKNVYIGVIIGKNATSVTLNVSLTADIPANSTLTFGAAPALPTVTGTVNATLQRFTLTNGSSAVAVGDTTITFAAGVPAMAAGTALYLSTGARVGVLTAAVTAGQTTPASITSADVAVPANASLISTLCTYTTSTIGSGYIFGSAISGVGIAAGTTVISQPSVAGGVTTVTLSSPCTVSNVGQLRVTYGNGYSPVGSTSGNKFGFFRSQLVYNLESGVDGYNSITTADFMTGYDLFKDVGSVQVDHLIMGSANDGINDGELTRYCIESIAEVRKDCIVYHSPKLADVLNVTPEAAMSNIIAYRQKFNNSTYAVMDTGWKYQYDRFADTYRWVPLNADIAGLSAQVDRTNDVWWSFAGYSRGLIKNVVKLAFNPARKETQRDVLYPLGINPVVAEEGAGTVLLGDTTMTTDSTLFGQIGIRKLFIALERTIGDASKRNLFEFNDEPTQTRFFNSTSKYLRDIQGRRGVADFKVICDSTVNTPIIVESKRFVGKIYVKPNMSINWAELNFTAVGASVAFSEIG